MTAQEHGGIVILGFPGDSMRALAVLTVASLLAGCGRDDQIVPLEPAADPRHAFGKYLAFDASPDGRPVMGYHHMDDDQPGFAVGQVLEGGRIAWRHEEIADPGGSHLDMAVAPDGTVWMAYRSALGTLRAAHRVGKTWTTMDVDSSPNTGLYTSMGISGTGQPVVAYHDATAGTLRRATWDGSQWSADTIFEGSAWSGTDPDGTPITRPASVGRFVDLTIRGNTETIAFYDAAKQSLELLEGFSGTYAHTTVAQGGDVGQWPSVWSDETNMWIAFQDVGKQDLLVAHREGGGAFAITTVDDGPYIGADSEVFVDAGKVGIAYFDGYHNDVKLATLSDGAWTTTTLGGDGQAVGFFNEVLQLRDGTFVGSYSYTDEGVWVTRL